MNPACPAGEVLKRVDLRISKNLELMPGVEKVAGSTISNHCHSAPFVVELRGAHRHAEVSSCPQR